MGLYIQPGSLEGGKYRGYLGQYDEETQRAIVKLAMEGFQDFVGVRPLSVRSYMFSASDATFPVLAQFGFRQSSISSPGRRVSRHAANWTGAETDAHYADRSSRLRRGDLPILELPVTTDPTRVRGGVASDLAIENGTLDDWHRPLIENQLKRMDSDQVPFRALCFYTRNFFAYHLRDDKIASTLNAIVGWLDSLRDRYDVRPATVGQAHAYFRDELRL